MIRVQTEDFEVGAETRRLYSAGAGAVVTFVGLVRELADQPISAMELEHYPGMTEKALAAIEVEARGRWPLQAVTIIHRVGRLATGDQIVFVGVASAHRQAAFEAAAFLMDYLKTRAPFWKKELGADGQGQWVDARESDEDALRRWQS